MEVEEFLQNLYYGTVKIIIENFIEYIELNIEDMPKEDFDKYIEMATISIKTFVSDKREETVKDLYPDIYNFICMYNINVEYNL